MPELTPPSTHYKDSFIAAIHEFQAEGRYDDVDIRALQQHFDAYVQDRLIRAEQPPRLGMVKETILWLVESDAYIGRISIRHELNDYLRRFGGHIGYDVRPSMRQRGYGTLMLRLALPHAHAVGITRALLTCDSTNVASRKIIQANGGIMEDEIMNEGHTVPTQRWWIDLDKEQGEK